MKQLFFQAAAWMNLKHILQSERSQTPKTTYCNMIPLNKALKGQHYNHAN